MENLDNYTGCTRHVLKKYQLQWLWRYAMVVMGLIMIVGTDALAQTFTNIDQAANGKFDDDPREVSWQNGNLNFQNAHFLETYSVPYRVRISGLTAGTTYTYIIGYDIREGGKMALDFLTYYQRLEPHAQFGHPAETIDPLSDLLPAFLAGITPATAQHFEIPSPDNFLVVNGNEQPKDYADMQNRDMTIYGGEITAIGYVSHGDLTASTSETRVYVTFTASGSNAVIAWGANIAGEVYWGENATAKDINGSPYHMRHIAWKVGEYTPLAQGGYTSIGNTDRSLKTDAIIQPPTCVLDSNYEEICEGESASFTVSVGDPGAGGPYIYSWTGPNGFTASTATITINNATTSDAGMYIATVTDKIGLSSSTCPAELVVNENPTASVDNEVVCEGSDATFQASPDDEAMYSYAWYAGTSASGTVLGSNSSYTIQDATLAMNGDQYTVRITNKTTGCYDDATATLTVYDNPDLAVQNLEECEDGTTGQQTFDLNDAVTDDGGGDLTFYASEDDAINEQDAISDPENYTVSLEDSPVTIWARSNNSDDGDAGCYTILSFTVTVNDNPDLTTHEVDYCEDEMVGVLLSSFNEAIGAQENDEVVWKDENDNTITELGNLAVGEHTFYATVTRSYGETESCDSETSLTVNVEACSRIQLLKLTDGAVDPTKDWSFTLSEVEAGEEVDEIATESTLGDADGVLFDGLILSRYKTYKICETNVGSGFTVVIQYYDENNVLQEVEWFDPDVMNGGGDFNQGEAMGNYCFYFGAGTDLELPANLYGTETPVYLRFRINNVPPPGGNARTPGYWKNWNTCSGGKQAETAARNGGSAEGFWLLDDHLPHTLWASNGTNFTIYDCDIAVLLLDERQLTGRNQKLASDAAYKLAKHLMTYQLNKKSGTYECQSAADAATEAEALLASLNFNGTLSSYLSNKGKGGSDPRYTRALELAKILDAYNNNLPCMGAMNATNVSSLKMPEQLESNQIMVYPTPFSDKATIEFRMAADENYVINLYDMKGALIKELKAGQAKAGELQQVEVDGRSLAEGLYIARMVSDSGMKSVKLLLKKQ